MRCTQIWKQLSQININCWNSLDHILIIKRYDKDDRETAKRERQKKEQKKKKKKKNWRCGSEIVQSVIFSQFMLLPLPLEYCASLLFHFLFSCPPSVRLPSGKTLETFSQHLHGFLAPLLAFLDFFFARPSLQSLVQCVPGVPFGAPLSLVARLCYVLIIK